MTPDTGDLNNNPYTGKEEDRMQIVTNLTDKSHPFDWRLVLGASLVVSGIMLFSEQALRTGYLALMAPLVSGIVLLGAGARDRRIGYIIGGGVMSGGGAGFIAAWWGIGGSSWSNRLGTGLFGLAVGFGLVTVLSRLLLKKFVWWPFVPATLLGALGIIFSFTPYGLLDFVLYIGGGLGIFFLATGIYKRLFGLIIPGALLLGVGPGVAFSWGHMDGARALAQTGAMLVWFAFGWALITLVARVIFQRFVWWPLIPGGILAMVGWGLYIGGNPGNAASFIGNTGSIAMIIFGLYLLLMRRGIRH